MSKTALVAFYEAQIARAKSERHPVLAASEELR